MERKITLRRLMTRITKYVLLPALFVVHVGAGAQDVVEVNLDVKHAVNGISELDRSRYSMIHASAADREWPSEAVKEQFLEDYDVYLGRNNGSMPWYLSQCLEDPEKAGWPSVAHLQAKGAEVIHDYKNNSAAHRYESRRGSYMVGGQESMYPNQTRLIGPDGAKWYLAKEGYEPLAEYYANYFKYFYGSGGESGMPQPTFVEVMNEPFVKSGDLGTTNYNLSQMHNVVARRIKELNPQIKVGGYSAAHPAYEAADFKHWESNWKLFMDVAGENMDFFALHLYDNYKDNNPATAQYRAGSNIEAILDMLEHYGTLKFGHVKPFCISEYGCLVDGGDPYTRERDWNNIRSFSTIQMQLLERPDVIAQALPFLLLKASWWEPEKEYRYPHRLFRQKKELEGETGEEWVYTEVVKFFDLWSQVRGTRVDSKSSNPDTQIDSYVKGHKAFVIVNNMHHEPRTVDLHLKGWGEARVDSVHMKHLHAEDAGVPALDASSLNAAPDSIRIGREATTVLEYTFDRDLVLRDSASETKYYADVYLQEITADRQIVFQINGVALSEYGESVLRLGTGRNFGTSLQPDVKVNGSIVAVPDNWRGDDQRNRDRFFGVLEIPVPFELLQENNQITLTFPDDGGHVSSLGMQVFNFSREIERIGERILDVSLDPESRIMKPGKQFQLDVWVSPRNVENRKVSWHSTDSTVATVSQDGLVEALSEGEAQIVVTTQVDELRDTCRIQVSEQAPDIQAEEVIISPESLSLINSHSAPLSAEVLPLDVDNKVVTWESLDPFIASVSEEGVVTGEAPGTTYIRAHTIDGSGISDSIRLEVTPLPNTIDCSLFPVYMETDTLLDVEVSYTLGVQMDIFLEMIRVGSQLPWVAENQVTLEPGAGTTLIRLRAQDRESGQPVFPVVGNYVLYAYIRDVGGDENTNSSRCYSTIFLTARDVTALEKNLNRELELFPNPAVNSLQIKGVEDQYEKFTIYNMQGLKLIEILEPEDHQCDISSLPAGTYCIRVTGKGIHKVLVFIKN